MTKQKVLILKMGYSETLDKGTDSRRVSLGDVLRTTPLLHLYKNDYVTWITSQEALPLLENNPYIERLLTYDLTTVLQLQSEEFDTMINLEKVGGICALADKIKAWRKYGFRFNTHTGSAEAYDRTFEVLAVSSDPKAKKENQKTSQELLFEMVGTKWDGEEYILGYQPKTEEQFDVGLNTRVGQKWPTKAWSMENWNRLENMLKKDGFKVTRQDEQDQRIMRNLYLYIDWINSCKLIVSNDSLGVHLALALKKKVLSLFGPTPHKEVHLYRRGKAILSENNFDCMPCFSGECINNHFCMDYIFPERVYKEIKEYVLK